MSITHAPSAPPLAGRASHRRQRRPDERVTLLGAAMDLVKPAEVFDFVARRLAVGQPTVVANHNLHSLALTRRDAELRAFYAGAHLVEVDSTPLILWARMMGRRSRSFHRCTYLDWRDEFWTRVLAEGWRVYFVGGRPEVADTAADHLRREFPGLKLDTHHGYFDPDPASAETEAVLEAIAAFQPDILLVGMGMPRQELWTLRNLPRLPVCAVFTVGAAFDYEAGAQAPAPRWLGALGVEWLYRLARDPFRLTHRYLVEPWRLAPAAWSDLRHRFNPPQEPASRSGSHSAIG